MKIDKLKDLILYQSENGNVQIEVLYDNEDFWLTQKTMAELFNVAENNITYHLQNIFKSGELNKDSVTQKIRVTASDGKKYNTNFYSLDAIIAVGYRVNSKEATSFRIWATNTLKDYIKKGYVLNTEIIDLKNDEISSDGEHIDQVWNQSAYMYFNVQKSTNVTLYALDVYGSYQHAQATISLSSLANIILNPSAYNIINFVDEGISKKYDNMRKTHAQLSGIVW